MFNLGYYTWVEQQGVSLADFDARRDPAFWDGLMDMVPLWDDAIDKFNTAALKRSNGANRTERALAV